MSLTSVRAGPTDRRVDAVLGATVVAVAAVVLFLPGLLPSLALAATVALAAAAVVRWPGVALGGLLVLLPMQNLVFGRLYAMGVPAALVGALTNVKELIVLVLAAVAARRVVRGESRLARLDHLALAYLGLLVAYIVLPTVLDPVVGPLFPGSPRGLIPRLQAFQTDGMFVVLFLAARHLHASPVWRQRLEGGLLLLGLVVAGAAFVEYLRPEQWVTFTQQWADVDRFGFEILNAQTALGGTTVVVGTESVRTGSLLLQHLQAGFYQLIPLAIAVRRLSRRFQPLDLAAAVAIGTSIVLTFTRSAVLGGLVGVILTLWALPRDAVDRRLRAGIVAVTMAVVGVWLAAATVLSERLDRLFAGTDPSAEGHAEAVATSLRILIAEPLGLGLATAPSVPDRFGARYVISENAILQIGIEAGVITMLVFVALLVVMLHRLFRVGRTPGRGDLAGAVAVAGVGLLVGAMFLHVWTNIPTALTYFAVAGLALNRTLYTEST